MFEIIFSVIAVLVVIGLVVPYFFLKKKLAKDWGYAVYFITVLSLGTVLNYMGISYAAKQDAAATKLPLLILVESIGAAIRSFTGYANPDSLRALSEVNTLYEVAVFVHYIAAIILTFAITINIFGKGIVNRFWVWVNSYRAKLIVVGSSATAEKFLSRLDRKRRRHTVIILEPDARNKRIDYIVRGFKVVAMKEGDKNKDLNEKVLHALKVAGFMRNKRCTQILSMTDDDGLNLLVAKEITAYIRKEINPTRDSQGLLNKLDETQSEKLAAMNLHAHIMYERLDRTEHFAFAEYALGRVRFFNPFEVRARKFVSENPITKLIPPHWINTKKGRLYNTSDKGCDRAYRFATFFVGYGGSNEQIFKKSVCDHQLLGAGYHARVFDKNAKALEKKLQSSSPGLFNERDVDGNIIRYGAELVHDPKGKTYFPNPEESCNIVFVDLDVLSSEFYQRMVTEIEGVKPGLGFDYITIIISLGDDKLNIETSLELRQKLYEKKLLKGYHNGKEYERVRIFVKISEDIRVWDDALLNDARDIPSHITTFGLTHEILTEDYIINEKLDAFAKSIANAHRPAALVTKWDTLSEFKRDSNRHAAMAIRTKLNLLGFDIDEKPGDTDEQTVAALQSAYGPITDILANKLTDNARNNLARTEHQRWSTLYLANGWTKFSIAETRQKSKELDDDGKGRQDEKSKQHACITTFEGLEQLRKIQAEAKMAKDKKLSLEQATREVDSIGYDFKVMDELVGHAEACKLKIVKKAPSIE